MPISMKATLFAFFISLAIFLTPETGLCAGRDTKIVTRIDTVTAVMKGGTLTIHVEGMASTPSMLGRGGELLKRGQAPNKDGLLEYELVFNPPQKNYTGDALKLVKTTLKVSSVPAGVKGVRIYAEYNELDGMLPEPKQEPASKKKEPFLKPEEPVVAKKEKPVAKKEEVAAKKEEQQATSQWWNPFHHKPATPQVNAPPSVAKKQELPPKKKEPVVKKEESVIAKREKPTLKREELAPKKPEATTLKTEEKKSQWWNPFHHKPAASQVNAPPPATKKEAPLLKKKEPVVVKKEEPVIAKKEKPTPKPEATTLKTEEKKSQWWNPFHRKPATSPVNAPPPEPKKQEPTLKKNELVVKKENPIVVKKEKPALKQEELAPKKQETPMPKKKELATKKKEPVVKKEETAPKKKKSQWWNPFHRKPDASQSSDESPR
jgi:hypothetical protein